jgi:exodeoxyribonuclease V gamma subunit
VSLRTRHLANDGVLAFAPVESPEARLLELVTLYRDGLATPLHFFPKSSWEYVRAGNKLTAAAGKWLSTKYRKGESAGAAYRLAFRASVAAALDASFEANSRRVFDPMRDHTEPGSA